MPTLILNGLGPALRWLRDRRGRKQYQVAAAAGITKGMLSAYETGRQRPSLETLDKVLETLQCDLNHLHNALQIVNGRPEAMVRAELHGRQRDAYPLVPSAASDLAEAPPVDLYSVIGARERLDLEEERALSEMLDGFHRLLRYLHQARAQPEEPPPSGSSS